jgi:hypothetical protein
MSNTTSTAFHTFKEKVAVPIILPKRNLPIENGKIGETVSIYTVEDYLKDNPTHIIEDGKVLEKKTTFEKIQDWVIEKLNWYF